MSEDDVRTADDSLLEPLTAYKTKYQEAFQANCKEYFDGLIEKSGIDLAQNRQTVSKYDAKMRECADVEHTLSRFRTFRGLLIFWIVAGAALLLAAVGLFVSQEYLIASILLVAGVVSIVAASCLLAKKVVPALRENEALHAEIKKAAEELLQQAWQQMEPLNALFDNNVTKKLIEKTVPLIQLDDYFNVRRYDYLRGKYGYGDDDDSNASTLGILTGEIIGNPFVEDRVLVHTLGTYTYTGSLVIYWETYETDSEGNLVTVHHSQTLTASVTRPKPYYSEQTRLVYGNEAAPELHFSRRPSHVEDLSEKERASKVKRGVKKIRKQQKEAMRTGRGFTEMGNEEFDVLFGALDRDNDVQFRLLFTPLAQKNLLALMKDSEGYGDDFYMRKAGCLNYVITEHSAHWDMDERGERYHSYSADLAWKKFLSFQADYFRSLYFDLAPLLSIPLYQQYKPHEYIYQESYPRCFTWQETECAVNHMPSSAFAPEGAATPSILKTGFLQREGSSDRVNVRAYSYQTYERVEYVPVHGGDGNTHLVPVPWIEYVPVYADTVVQMKELGLSEREFEKEAGSGVYRSAMEKYENMPFGYHHGILCCVVPEDQVGFDADFTIDKSTGGNNI